MEYGKIIKAVDLKTGKVTVSAILDDVAIANCIVTNGTDANEEMANMIWNNLRNDEPFQKLARAYRDMIWEAIETAM